MKCVDCQLWHDVGLTDGRRRCLLAAPLRSDKDGERVAMTGAHDGCAEGRSERISEKRTGAAAEGAGGSA